MSRGEDLKTSINRRNCPRAPSPEARSSEGGELIKEGLCRRVSHEVFFKIDDALGARSQARNADIHADVHFSWHAGGGCVFIFDSVPERRASFAFRAVLL